MTRPHPRLVEVADVAVVSVLMKLLAACGVKEPIQKRCSTKDKQSRSETFSHAHQRTAATVAMADVVTRHFSSKSSDISGRLFNEGTHGRVRNSSRNVWSRRAHKAFRSWKCRIMSCAFRPIFCCF